MKKINLKGIVPFIASTSMLLPLLIFSEAAFAVGGLDRSSSFDYFWWLRVIGIIAAIILLLFGLLRFFYAYVEWRECVKIISFATLIGVAPQIAYFVVNYFWVS